MGDYLPAPGVTKADVKLHSTIYLQSYQRVYRSRIKPVFNERTHPVIRGHFLRTVSYLPHVNEPVTKGHLSCRDTFSQILTICLLYGYPYGWIFYDDSQKIHRTWKSIQNVFSRIFYTLSIQ